MKTPRLFILSGALALIFTFVIQTVGWTPPAGADPLTIRRADPWAGDPDDPIPSYSLPEDEISFVYVDDQDASSRITTTYTGSRTSTWSKLWFLFRACVPLNGR